MSPKIIR